MWAAAARGPSRSPAGPTRISNYSLSRQQRRRQRHVQPQRQRPVVGILRVRGLFRHGDLHAVRRDQQHRQRLYLGYNAGSSGTYSLSGSGQLVGQLPSTWAIPARAPSRSRAEPTALPSYLYLGSNAGGSGTYSLSGGQLSAYYRVRRAAAARESSRRPAGPTALQATFIWAATARTVLSSGQFAGVL